MKINEVMKTIEKVNDLREELKIERAYVELYVDDHRIGGEHHTLRELIYSLESEYVDEFIENLKQAELTKTYNNTLSTTVECRGIKKHVDLFVDC